jgi:hypothetical protein
MSHPQKGTEAYERERQRDRERKARKRAEKQLAKQKQAEIEKSPESAMQEKKPPESDIWTPFMVQMRRQQREHSK